MDFTTKDFDCSAVNTAMNELLNVQNKKQFDIADVDNIDVRLEVKLATTIHTHKTRVFFLLHFIDFVIFFFTLPFCELIIH